MNYRDNYDKKEKNKKIKRTLLWMMILFVMIGGIFTIYGNLGTISEKCDADISAINHKINQTGGISSNDELYQKLGIDGCADLSKSPRGIITSEIHTP